MRRELVTRGGGRGGGLGHDVGVRSSKGERRRLATKKKYIINSLWWENKIGGGGEKANLVVKVKRGDLTE